MLKRPSLREFNEIRNITIETKISPYAEGSCLVKFGNTHVLCTASVDSKLPPWLRNSGKGWVTAEYGMLPRSTHSRMDREVTKGKASGRTQEIQRLIGRSLRSITDLSIIGERTIYIDCDVLQADGGTRTAAITGSYVALHQAFDKMVLEKTIEQNPLKSQLAAISVGIVDGDILLDLCYEEDSIADVDMNIIMTKNHDIVEIQGTAEQAPFSISTANEMIKTASSGIDYLVDVQNRALTIN